jgi:hypothetical protein
MFAMPDTTPTAADRAEVHTIIPFTGTGGVIAIAALCFGREVFIPMALAIELDDRAADRSGETLVAAASS